MVIDEREEGFPAFHTHILNTFFFWPLLKLPLSTRVTLVQILPLAEGLTSMVTPKNEPFQRHKTLQTSSKQG